MAIFYQYYPNYKQLYPEISTEVLDCLRKSDRKMKYAEVDLKVEDFEQDLENNSASFTPSREDSYERLMEDDQQFAQDELSPEAVAVRKDELHRLRLCLARLSNQERTLIQSIYFEEISEPALSAQTGVSQQLINYRKQKILCKLKKLLDS